MDILVVLQFNLLLGFGVSKTMDYNLRTAARCLSDQPRSELVEAN